MISRLKTVFGSPFEYERHPDGEIIVYTTDRAGQIKSKAAIAIKPDTIALVKTTIARQGEIKVGANRTRPSAGSLGAMLKAEGQSPQLLSYLIPILAEQGFCNFKIIEGLAIAVELRVAS
jgi:hypothetical protein